MKLTDYGSMREYIKRITEIFDELAVVAEAVTDEDKVVYLLAGLPESYDVLVTTLESGTDMIPALESMTEQLLREEQKLKWKKTAEASSRIFLTKDHSRIKKIVHMSFLQENKRDCRKFAQAQPGTDKKRQTPFQEQRSAIFTRYHADHTCSCGKVWIVDSGATCHMCNDRTAFSKMEELMSSNKVTMPGWWKFTQGDGWRNS